VLFRSLVFSPVSCEYSLACKITLLKSNYFLQQPTLFASLLSAQRALLAPLDFFTALSGTLVVSSAVLLVIPVVFSLALRNATR